MPFFKKVLVTADVDGEEIEVEVDVDFEIFCADCGAGICDHGDTRRSRYRGMPQVTVKPCSKCIENLKSDHESEVSALDSEIDELKEQIKDLEERL